MTGDEKVDRAVFVEAALESIDAADRAVLNSLDDMREAAANLYDVTHAACRLRTRLDLHRPLTCRAFESMRAIGATRWRDESRGRLIPSALLPPVRR